MAKILTDDKRALLSELINSSAQWVREISHARNVSKAYVGWTDQAIAEALDLISPTIQRIRQRFIEQSFAHALNPATLLCVRFYYLRLCSEMLFL